MQIICKYQSLLNKSFDYSCILISSGVPGTDSLPDSLGLRDNCIWMDGGRIGEKECTIDLFLNTCLQRKGTKEDGFLN